MSKKTIVLLKSIIAFSIVVTWGYVVESLIAWNFNPSSWTLFGKIIGGGFILLFAFGVANGYYKQNY